MKAARLFGMFKDIDNAKVFVDIEGTLIPITGARYHAGPRNQVVLSIDRLKMLQLLEELENPTDQQGPHR